VVKAKEPEKEKVLTKEDVSCIEQERAKTENHIRNAGCRIVAGTGIFKGINMTDNGDKLTFGGFRLNSIDMLGPMKNIVGSKVTIIFDDIPEEASHFTDFKGDPNQQELPLEEQEEDNITPIAEGKKKKK